MASPPQTPRCPPREEPAEKQVESDARLLLHSKADGKLVIEHESPHKDAGLHEVIDDVHSHRNAWKADIQEKSEE